MVTHDFEEASAIATKVIIYEHGKIAQIGSPKEIQNRPVNGYVYKLVKN
jgi:ABC-type proline/glycine betaine transport system ATPase subunit